jgi:hypothetical protein
MQRSMPAFFSTKVTRTMAWQPAISGLAPLPTGLGWFVQGYNGQPVIWQFGRIDGAYSSLIVKDTEPSPHIHCIGQQRRLERAVRAGCWRRHQLALRKTLPQNIRALTVIPSAGRATMMLLVVVLCSFPHRASADYIFTPFVGGKFAGHTAFLNLEQSAGFRPS